MPSMSEIVAEHTALADEEHQQLLADLAFSDLVRWVPVYPFWDASGNTSVPVPLTGEPFTGNSGILIEVLV